MSKFIKSIICIVCTCTLFLGGCSTGITEKEAQNNKEEKVVTPSENNKEEKVVTPSENNKEEKVVTSSENNKEEKVVTSLEKIENENGTDSSNDNNGTYLTKQIYLEKLNELEADLNISFKERYSGTTQQMIEASSEEYREWDNMLNQVYSELKQQLTEEEMDKLTEEELNWIENRDEKSEAAANEFKGGTMEPLNGVMSLAASTKERCYELVNQYMK